MANQGEPMKKGHRFRWQVMNIGDYRDVQELVETVGPGRLADTLT